MLHIHFPRFAHSYTPNTKPIVNDEAYSWSFLFKANQLTPSSSLFSWLFHTLPCSCFFSPSSWQELHSGFRCLKAKSVLALGWNMLKARACPSCVCLSEAGIQSPHTHLVCTPEMRRKVSRSSSLYQSGAGAHVWFTSCLCSKWCVTLLTSRPPLLWSADRPPAPPPRPIFPSTSVNNFQLLFLLNLSPLHLSPLLTFFSLSSCLPVALLSPSSLLFFFCLVLSLSVCLYLYTAPSPPPPPPPVRWPDAANWKHVSHPATNYSATASTDTLKDVLGVTGWGGEGGTYASESIPWLIPLINNG